MERGRWAFRPTQIPARGWLDIARRVAGRLGSDWLGLVSAGVAFFGLLAIFPAISALLAIGGLILDRQAILDQLQQLNGVVPVDVLDIIRDQAGSVAAAPGLALGPALRRAPPGKRAP